IRHLPKKEQQPAWNGGKGANEQTEGERLIRWNLGRHLDGKQHPQAGPENTKRLGVGQQDRPRQQGNRDSPFLMRDLAVSIEDHGSPREYGEAPDTNEFRRHVAALRDDRNSTAPAVGNVHEHRADPESRPLEFRSNSHFTIKALSLRGFSEWQ